jgi:hypothetical protein
MGVERDTPRVSHRSSTFVISDEFSEAEIFDGWISLDFVFFAKILTLRAINGTIGDLRAAMISAPIDFFVSVPLDYPSMLQQHWYTEASLVCNGHTLVEQVF